MDSEKRDELLERSIDPASVRVVGGYTSPRSYGVYRLPAGKPRGREYRFGNHPVRKHELVREYGVAELQALFAGREDAMALAALLNGQ